MGITNSYSGVFPYETLVTGLRLYFDPSTGYLYANNGQVLNPATGNLVGAFDLSAFYVGVFCGVDSAPGISILRRGNDDAIIRPFWIHD